MNTYAYVYHCLYVSRAGSQDARAATSTKQQRALAASLEEKYSNECDLFGCHTVLARPPPHSVPSRGGGQRLAEKTIPAHNVRRWVNGNAEEQLDSKLWFLSSSLVAANETAMAAYTTTLTLESELHTIEEKSHLDRVQLRTEHAMRTKDDILLRQSQWHEHAAIATADTERKWLVHMEKVAHVEGVELAAARKRLHLSTELQTKAWAEAHTYRDSLEKATRKLVTFKKPMSKQELELENAVDEDAKDAQKQMMQEEDADSSSQMSEKEIIDRLTEEVRRLTVELKQRESVIQLQQKVIKVQAHEVKQLETSAEQNVDKAAETMSSIMKSAEAAMAGETVKHETEEEHENAEIEAKHPGIDPTSIPSAFFKPPAKVVPEPTSWRSFGEDAVANNPNNAVPLVGPAGVVADENFAAGVKGAHGTKTKEEEATEQAAVEEADTALQAFDQEEAAQKEAASVFFSKGASPSVQAHADTQKNEQAFENMISARPAPESSVMSIHDYLSTAAVEREKVKIELAHEHQQQVAQATHRARQSERADTLVRGMLTHTDSVFEKNDTSSVAGAISSTLNPFNPVSPLSPKNILDPAREFNVLKTQLKGAFQGGHASNANGGAAIEGEMPSRLPSMQPLKSGSQLGGIAGALNAQTPAQTAVQREEAEREKWSIGDDHLHKDKSSFLFKGTDDEAPATVAMKAAGGAAAAGGKSAGQHAAAAATLSPTLSKRVDHSFKPDKFASSAKSAAIAAKAAGIASFIVSGHTPVSGHVKPHLRRAAAKSVLQAMSLEPQNAVLPPLALPVTQVVKHTAKRAVPAAKPMATLSAKPAVAKAADKALAAEIHRATDHVETHTADRIATARHADTLAEDLSRAAQQLDSYNFLQQKTTLSDAVLPPHTLITTQTANIKSVAQQMEALENGAKATRHAQHDTWVPSGLKVKGEGKTAHTQYLAQLPSDMRGGLHIAATFAAASATHSASFRDNNAGAPAHASALTWRIAEAQQNMKMALEKEAAAARERVETAQKAEVTEHKAALLAEKEVKRLDAIEATAAVRAAYDTAQDLRERHTYAVLPSQPGTAAHAQTPKKSNLQSAPTARYRAATPSETISAALFRAADSVREAESALGDDQDASASRGEMPVDVTPSFAAAIVSSTATGGIEEGVDMQRRRLGLDAGQLVVARPSTSRDVAHAAGMAQSRAVRESARVMQRVKGGEGDTMHQEEVRLQEHVGGPIKSSLARQIVADLSKLTDMTKQMKVRGDLFGEREFARHAASVDARAAVQELVQVRWGGCLLAVLPSRSLVCFRVRACSLSFSLALSRAVSPPLLP